MRKKIKSGPTQIVLIVGHCVGIDLVPQKTLIPKIILLTVRKNPGLQPDTAS